MFKTNFGQFVCDGDKITCKVDGFTCAATVHHDSDMGPPWKEHDGQSVITTSRKQ
jgi:hypothetical protein